MLWTNGNAIIPVDFRVYDKDNDLKTKDDHFKDTLEESKPQGLFHGFVSFDG
jgi:putative transposase